MKPTYEQLEQQLAAVVAENAGLKQAVDATIGWQESTDAENVESIRMLLNIETPATDAYLAEVRAQAIRDALGASSDYLDTDYVMDRLDISYEDAELRTSGAIELHDALVAIANELRQGAKHE